MCAWRMGGGVGRARGGGRQPRSEKVGEGRRGSGDHKSGEIGGDVHIREIAGDDLPGCGGAVGPARGMGLAIARWRAAEPAAETPVLT